MLKGQKVFLRYVIREDLENLSSLMNDIELKGEFARTNIKSPVLLEQEFSSNGLCSEANELFVIFDFANNLIGTIGHMKTVPYSSAREIGFSIFKEENRGKGYATEAVSLLTKYLFETSPINRVQICMPVGHEACEKVVNKCGFKFEGTIRGSIFVRGCYLDTKMYSKLRNEHEKIT